MKNLIYIFSLLTFYSAFGQTKTAQDFGFRHIVFNYKNESVDILVKSKKGEENIPKPIFLFCQGSLPIPLIIYDGKESFGTFPFLDLKKDYQGQSLIRVLFLGCTERCTVFQFSPLIL